MNRAPQAVTKAKLIEQFDTVVADTEQLLKSVASAGGEQTGALRANAQKSLERAKEGLRDFQHAAAEKTRAAADATDEYMHEHPWRAAGVAAGLTAVAALAIGLLLNRR
jgi:ElaB/YqjD/DUF883 family membrane-anchored ribosome-binding protein